jgi:hypothetical protein
MLSDISMFKIEFFEYFKNIYKQFLHKKKIP